MKFQNLILTLTITFIFTSCNPKQFDNDQNNEENIVVETNKKETSKKTSNCLCFDGIGSRKGNDPIHTFEFSNGKKIIVCGYLDKETEEHTISEFNIFDCETEKSLVEYGATEICKIVQKKDTLEINDYQYLPVLKNFEWKLVKISKQIITNKNNQFIVSHHIPDVENYEIDEAMAEEFLRNLKKGEGFGSNWEFEICFLEVLALKGNEKAWDILKNYETFVGQETDGAIAETWKEAEATVSWIKKHRK